MWEHLRLQPRLTIILVAFALIPLLTITSITYHNNYEVLKTRRGERLQFTAEIAVARLNELTFFALEGVKSLAKSEVFNDLLIDDADLRIHSALKNYSRSYGIFSEIIVVNLSGKVIAATVYDKKGTRLTGVSWLAKSANVQDAFVEQVRYAPLAGGVTIPVVSPIKELDQDNNKVGYIVAYLHWSELLNLISSLNLGKYADTPDNFAVLFDEQANSIAGPDFTLFSEAEAEDEHSISNVNLLAAGYTSPKFVLQGQNGYQLETIDNKDYLIGYASTSNSQRVSPFDWGVMVVQNTDLSLRPVAKLRMRTLLFVAVVLILSLVTAYYVSRRFSMPLHRLTRHANMLADGQLDSHFEVTSHDEIGLLGNAFNQMSSKLQRSFTELEKSLDQALDADRTKTQFLANMSHEIRTPLVAIIGFSESLQDNYISRVDADDAIDTIVRNGRHLLELINDILDISKIASNRLEVERVAVCYVEIINEIQHVIGVQARNKGLTFDINYSLPVPYQIVSDPTRLKQILFNLCSNAVKFTSSGGIQIEVDYEREAGMMCFTVIDTGIGISKDKLANIFQPFSQADSSTTRKYGGTGLGLYISKRFSELLGGSLSFDSKLEQGSRFEARVSTGVLDSICFITEPSMLTVFQTKVAAASPVPQLCGRVLLAEDRPDNQKLIAMYVKITGAEISIVDNGRLAVEKALAEDFDLILMDIQMPVMDGVAATEMLRKVGYSRPIIALTANIMKGDAHRYSQAGFTYCLGKPIERVLFFKALADYLNVDEIKSRKERAVQLRNSDFDVLASDFLTNLPCELNDLTSAAAENRWDDFDKLIHGLKGTGGSFGYPEITDLCIKIEELAKSGNRNLAAEMLDQLEDLSKSAIHSTGR